MQINSNKISLQCAAVPQHDTKALEPFNESVIEFLNALSSFLLKTKENKKFPDIITFAFFCRRANIVNIKNKYGEALRGRVGRGLVFHVAPSNVPINFAYSLVAGLLAGNANIVKASSKNFEQTRIVAKAIDEVLAQPQFAFLSSYVCVVTYPRDEQAATEQLSSICSARVIWGGDATVAEIRKAYLPPRAFDVTFADRYSLAVIDAKSIIKHENMHALAQDFYNDTYLYDQNACSAPRLIYWLGEQNEVLEAQNKFWNAIYAFIKDKYELSDVVSVDKYTALCKAAIELDDVKAYKCEDNLISRFSVSALNVRLPDFRCAGGSFVEYSNTEIEPLFEIVTQQYQTLSYFGINAEEIAQKLIKSGAAGVDRIVPIGKTADFSLVWDGYDLITTLSRAIKLV